MRGSGRGAASGLLCTESQRLGRIQGNTCHGHKRFGTYLQSIFPRAINTTVAEDGLLPYEDRSRCAAFTPSGDDRGVSSVVDVDACVHSAELARRIQRWLRLDYRSRASSRVSTASSRASSRASIASSRTSSRASIAASSRASSRGRRRRRERAQARARKSAV